MAIHIYTVNNCTKCDNLRRELDERGAFFVKRNLSRLINPQDAFDEEARKIYLLEGSMLPIVLIGTGGTGTIGGHIWKLDDCTK